VGDSAKGRKGTSWGNVRRLLGMVDDAWAADNIVSGLSSGEGLIWEVRDYVDEDDTGIHDKRRVVIEPEFAKVLRLNHRQGNTLPDVLRDFWDKGDARVMNKNTPVRTTDAHISVVGHITTMELRKLLTHVEIVNGFANRFLWCCVRRSKYLPDGGRLTDRALIPLAAELEDRIRRLDEPKLVKRDAEASELWNTIYAKLSDGCPGTAGAITGRAEAQALRLTLIYSQVDGSDVIRLEHLNAALACLEYVADTARYTWGTSLGDPLADDILVHLKERTPAGMTKTQIFDALGRNKRAAEVNRALQLLKESKLACCESAPTKGRPAEVWYAGRTVPASTTVMD